MWKEFQSLVSYGLNLKVRRKVVVALHLISLLSSCQIGDKEKSPVMSINFAPSRPFFLCTPATAADVIPECIHRFHCRFVRAKWLSVWEVAGKIDKGASLSQNTPAFTSQMGLISCPVTWTYPARLWSRVVFALRRRGEWSSCLGPLPCPDPRSSTPRFWLSDLPSSHASTSLGCATAMPNR